MTTKTTGSTSTTTSERTPVSELIIAQIKSRTELTRALHSGGLLLATVRQARNRRAVALRGHFQALEGGLR